MDLTDADKVWFEQQKLTVAQGDQMKVIALDNDKSPYLIALEHTSSPAPLSPNWNTF